MEELESICLRYVISVHCICIGSIMTYEYYQYYEYSIVIVIVVSAALNGI